jgi:hypothetical protein
MCLRNELSSLAEVSLSWCMAHNTFRTFYRNPTIHSYPTDEEPWVHNNLQFALWTYVQYSSRAPASQSSACFLRRSSRDPIPPRRPTLLRLTAVILSRNGKMAWYLELSHDRFLTNSRYSPPYHITLRELDLAKFRHTNNGRNSQTHPVLILGVLGNKEQTVVNSDTSANEDNSFRNHIR